MADVRDFPGPEPGKAIPHGVHDMTASRGWIGVDHETASFAVEGVRMWRWNMGRPLYLDAGRLLVTADGGGSDRGRSRLSKPGPQRLAD